MSHESQPRMIVQFAVVCVRVWERERLDLDLAYHGSALSQMQLGAAVEPTGCGMRLARHLTSLYRDSAVARSQDRWTEATTTTTRWTPYNSDLFCSLFRVSLVMMVGGGGGCCIPGILRGGSNSPPPYTIDDRTALLRGGDSFFDNRVKRVI